MYTKKLIKKENNYRRNLLFLSTSKHLRLSVILITFYEILKIIYKPSNGSNLKLLITLFFISSFVYLFQYFLNNIKKIQSAFKPIYFVFLVSLFVGIFNILRSIEFKWQSLITLFGNRDTSLAMLLPMIMVLGLKLNNLIWFNQFCLNCMKIGLFIVPLSYFNSIFSEISVYFLGFNLFSLALFVYQSKSDKIVLVFSTIIFVLSNINSDGRLTILQIFFVIFGIIFHYFFVKLNLKVLRNFILISMVAFPFILILIGFPFFEFINNSNNTQNASISTTDTRTFLYTEVVEDLKNTNSIVFGKGALGKYYSAYFEVDVESGESKDRINVEVGFLSMLLKGGILNATLNFIIFFYALFLAYFSRNKFTQRLSFLVVCHILSLFVGNIPQYTSLNFSVWIAIGGCISIAVRENTDINVVSIFKNRKHLAFNN